MAEPVLYFVFAPGCTACAAAEPQLDKFMRDHPWQSVLKLNASGPFIERLGVKVKATPTYVLKVGQEAVLHVGTMSAAQIDKWMRKVTED